MEEESGETFQQMLNKMRDLEKRVNDPKRLNTKQTIELQNDMVNATFKMVCMILPKMSTVVQDELFLESHSLANSAWSEYLSGWNYTLLIQIEGQIQPAGQVTWAGSWGWRGSECSGGRQEVAGISSQAGQIQGPEKV